MTRTGLISMILSLSATILLAETTKEFPAHWGKPPEIQLRDYVELPDGYGHGSSTLKNWITANLKKDQAAGKFPEPKVVTTLYQQNFESLETDKLPDELMVLGGEFAVKADGTNKFLELPGTPLDSFATQFGPAEKENVVVGARVFATARGRRMPTFGVGLGGVSGYKLQVSPGKKALEVLKDQELKASVNFDWNPGTWTQLRLRINKLASGEWKVEGKAWPEGEREPKVWTFTLRETEEPVPGKASVLGSPFAGTPIWFDDLLVEKLADK